MAVLPLYSVHCIHGDTALIFRTLCPWLYEVSSINMALLMVVDRPSLMGRLKSADDG